MLTRAGERSVVISYQLAGPDAPVLRRGMRGWGGGFGQRCWSKRAEQGLGRVEERAGARRAAADGHKEESFWREQCWGLCSPVLCCSRACSIAQGGMGWHSMARHGTKFSDIARYSTAWHSISWRGTVFLGIARCLV